MFGLHFVGSVTHWSGPLSAGMLGSLRKVSIRDGAFCGRESGLETARILVEGKKISHAHREKLEKMVLDVPSVLQSESSLLPLNPKTFCECFLNKASEFR